MAAPLSPIAGLPAAEPKNGDFVAYLEAIERAQLRKLPAPASVAGDLNPPAAVLPPAPDGGAPVLTPAQAEALRARLRADAGSGLTPWKLGIALFGSLLLASGLFGKGGFVAAMVGAVLLWQVLVGRRRPRQPTAGDEDAPPTARQAARRRSGR